MNTQEVRGCAWFLIGISLFKRRYSAYHQSVLTRRLQETARPLSVHMAQLHLSVWIEQGSTLIIVVGHDLYSREQCCALVVWLAG